MEYSIKQVAERTHLAPHTLRYYEKEGLLPFVERTDSGIRRFSEADMEWLSLICCLKSTGMPIRQIKEFVQLSMQGQGTLKARCEMLTEHKKAVKEEIRMMEQHLEKVTHKIEFFTKKYHEYEENSGIQEAVVAK